MDPDKQKLDEIYRLTLENNKMLHKAHRHALWGGIIKFAIYFFLLVIAPLLFYQAYLAPIIEQMTDTYQQVQGTSAKVQTQFSDIQNILNQIKQPFSSQE